MKTLQALLTFGFMLGFLFCGIRQSSATRITQLNRAYLPEMNVCMEDVKIRTEHYRSSGYTVIDSFE